MPSTGHSNAGIRIQRDGGVCSKEAEYFHAIHCDATGYGPLQGDGADARDVGSKKVVVTGGPGPGGRNVGVSGGVGGRIRRGGGRGRDREIVEVRQ